MSPQKVILHHLDSPFVWEQDQAERAQSQRRKLAAFLAVISVSVTTALLHRGEAVEDYSNYSASGPAISVEHVVASSPAVDPDSYLADSGLK